MAKRNGTRLQPAVVESESGTAIDYGTFANWQHNLYSLSQVWRQPSPSLPTATASLQVLLDRLRGYLRTYVIPAEALRETLPTFQWVTQTADLGDGPQGYLFRAGPWNGVEHAADMTMQLVNLLRGVIASDHDAQLVLTGLSIGQALAELNSLPNGPAALAGKRQAARNAGIAKSRELPDEQLRERHQAVQAELAAQARRGERPKRKNAYQAVAGRLDVSWQTVRDAFLAIDRAKPV
jgi:hypothetical protein